jgi:hypothetical protein
VAWADVGLLHHKKDGGSHMPPNGSKDFVNQYSSNGIWDYSQRKPMQHTINNVDYHLLEGGSK